MIRKVKAAFLAALRRYAVVPVAFGALACGPFADPLAAESGGREECGSTALAKLTTGYALDLGTACGSTPVKQCAEILKKPVQDKWFPRFDAWAEECD